MIAFPVRPRFSLRQLFFAFSLVAVCLGAYILFAQWRHRAYARRIYSSFEVYQALCASDQLEVFRVQPGKRINPAIEPWQIPELSMIQPCTRDSTPRLRQLLTYPQNFDVGFVKDFTFNPTYMVRASTPALSVELYLDFESLVAAIVIDGEYVWTLYPDNIAAELEQVLSDAYDEAHSQ